MIFNKDSHFSYPVISPFTDDYIDAKFDLEVSLEDLGDSYRFRINYKLSSVFIKNLILNNKADIYAVISSKDTKYFLLKADYIDITKSRISVNKKTDVQLFVVSNTRISMRMNLELDEFFANEKEKIYVPPFSVLAMSNIEKFNGDLKKPFDLFQQILDPSIKSDIQIDLGTEMIIVKYRDKNFQYNDVPQFKSTLNNHYVYIGLQKALMKMIIDLKEDDEDGLDIEEMNEPENKLYYKLYNLLKNKGVDEINYENLDEVIYDITDKIIEKHTEMVKRLWQNED